MTKEYFFFAVIVIMVVAITFAAVKFVPQKAQAAQEHTVFVANSDFGVINLDTDSVQALKKNDNFYLVATVEERYTDAEFLQSLRSGENMEDAAASLYLYMFSNDGAHYWVPNRYLIDDKGHICADLGDIKAQPVNNDPILIKIYTAALKVLENKKQQQTAN